MLETLGRTNDGTSHGRPRAIGHEQDTYTDEDLRTGIAHAEYNVACEIDRLDLDAREGWTVLIWGSAHHVDTAAERTSFIAAGVEPWTEGEPEHLIPINPTRIWGHRIRRA
jgi:hypothetical protein